MTDRIELLGLRARGFHGVLEHERRDGQDFVVDVGLDVDTAAAAASDDLAQTIDYGTLAESIAAVVSGDPVDLIETLAQRIADVCLRDPRVRAVDVAVHKPSAPVTVPVEDVIVRIRRVAG
jgi:7,8-dihydroneopterin aldolase/epimerase/oxygenase